MSKRSTLPDEMTGSIEMSFFNPLGSEKRPTALASYKVTCNQPLLTADIGRLAKEVIAEASPLLTDKGDELRWVAKRVCDNFHSISIYADGETADEQLRNSLKKVRALLEDRIIRTGKNA